MSAVAAGFANGAMAAPVLELDALVPDRVKPGDPVRIPFDIRNVGDEDMTAGLMVKITFPNEVAVVEPAPVRAPSATCAPSGQVNECVIDVAGVPIGRSLGYEIFSFVDPGAVGTFDIQIEASGGGATNTATVSSSMVAGAIGPFDIKSFGVDIADNPSWQPAQAGSVPSEIVTTTQLRSAATLMFGVPISNSTRIAAPESFRDVIVHVPPGFVGYPTATPVRCTAAELALPAPAPQQIPSCPPDSQIGLVRLNATDLVPLYNLVPPHGMPAQFGFYYQGVIVTMRAKVRPSDHGIDVVAEKSPSSMPVPKFEVRLWGVPSDSSHDRLRAKCTIGMSGAEGTLCPSQAQRVPFLRLPTSCSGAPLPWSIDMNTHENPGTFHHADTSTPAVEGCEVNPFDPELALTPSTKAPHAPSGVDATVSMPQDFAPTGIAQADLRRATVTLPEGMTINPSSADGLQACTDAQLRLRHEGPATCPEASKLGTVTLRTQLLDHDIGGSIFLRTQNSDDPLSGELFRIAVEIRSDEDGIAIRLPGAVKADPVTGRLTTVFDDLPQLPFDSMTLRFKTGPRAPLATPSKCGSHATVVQLVSWGEKVVDTSSSFETTGCKAPAFEPTLAAGVEDPAAGSSSPLHVRLTRSDGDGHFGSVSIDTPKGLLGRIKDVDPCASATADAGTCSASSMIGHATVGAGVGPNPFFLDTGRVYLTGPYKGAPYGLAVVTDAVAGPFDLGRVVVRSAIHVDRTTAQLKVVSDRFPTILKGVPLHIRSVRVSIDKPRFIVAPTNCAKKQFGGLATSTDGATAPLKSPFQIRDCAALRFTPRLGLRLTGPKQTRTGSHPGVKAVVRQAKGQANIARAAVTLPRSLALDPDNAGGLCEFEDGTKPDLENHCPTSSIVGRAKATTPLLDKPLTGDVYFVKNIKRNTRGNQIRTLPMLIVALRGEIAINLKGTSSTARDGRLINTFNNVPDAPVTKFNLNITGGKQGILTVTANTQGRLNLCTTQQTAQAKMTGQNSKQAAFPVQVKTPCANKRRR